MKKDNYRKILREKFRAANQLETGPLTEEDEEYLRILAEARANHAKIKAARQEARKRLAARAAAVFIVAALVSSSYLLGMKSDTKASADPDNEVKVVQQGDNIIIGQGVSENDENVGVVTKTYYSDSFVPEELMNRTQDLSGKGFAIEKVVVTKYKETELISSYYINARDEEVIISEQKTKRERTVMVHNQDVTYVLNGIKVYETTHDFSRVITFNKDANTTFVITIPLKIETNEKEALLLDLIS